MKRKLLTLTVTAMLLSSCGTAEKAENLKFKTVKNVKIQKPEIIKEKEYDTFSGFVIPAKEITLSPKVSGYLIALKVKAGDKIEKGQLIAVIDKKALTPDLKRALALIKEANAGLKETKEALKEVKAQKESAQAAYQLALKTYNRFKNLLKEEAVSKQKFDEVKTQLEIAKANLEAVEAKENQLKAKLEEVIAKKKEAEAVLEKAKTYISFTYLKSPIKGIVLKKLVDEGNLVSPQVGIVQIGTYPLQVKAFVDTSLKSKIHVGQEIDLQVNNYKFKGKISEIDEMADPITHKFPIKIELKGNVQNIIPGMYATIFIPKESEKIIAVPKSAIYKVGALEYVYVLDSNNVAHLRYIKTGKTLPNGMVEVISGLYPQDKIAVSNVESLCDGAKVEG